MIRIMGALMTLFKKSKEPTRKLTLAMLGLDNAGKTLTAKGLLGESAVTTEPTVGFDTMSFKIGRYDITLYDLGGGPRIRDIWDNYYHELYGVVFVVDSSSVDRMNECKAALVRLLANEKVKGKPMLLLANKQDVPGCLDENELREQLDLEHLVNEHCVPCFLVTCSAAAGAGKKMDGAIRAGLHWLLEAIEENFDELHKRISADIETKQQYDKEEKRKRLERVRLAREQREKQEQEERERNGHVDPATQHGDAVDADDGSMSNPFQPLDRAKLEAKEQELKKNKKKQQEAAPQAKQEPPPPPPPPQAPASAAQPTVPSASPQNDVPKAASPPKASKDEGSLPTASASKSDAGKSRSGRRRDVRPDEGVGGAAMLSAVTPPASGRVANGAPPPPLLSSSEKPGSPPLVTSAAADSLVQRREPAAAALEPPTHQAATAGGVIVANSAGHEPSPLSRRLPPLAPSAPLGPLIGRPLEDDEDKKVKQRKKKTRKSQVSPGDGGASDAHSTATSPKGSQDTLKRFSVLRDAVPEAPAEIAEAGPKVPAHDDGDDDAIVMS